MHSLSRGIPLASTLVRLALIAIASEGIYYFYFARTFPLAVYYDTPLLDLGKITGYSREAGYTFVLVFTALFGLYYAAYRLTRGHRSRACAGVVIGCGVVFGATLIQVYPIGAADIFDYIASARILAVYHENPFVRVAADFPNDPFVPFVAWKYAPAAYGPVWEWLSVAATLPAGGGLFANLVALKLLALAFYLGSTVLVHEVLGLTAPEFQLAGTTLVAWNPLVVYEVSANAHNDAAMVFLVLAAILMAHLDKKKLSIVALTISFLLKYVTIVLLPIFLVGMARRIQSPRSRLGFLSVSLLLAGGMTALAYLPFWAGLETASISRRQEMFTASLPKLALIALDGRIGTESAHLLISRAAAIALAVFAAFRAWRTGPQTSSIVTSSFNVLLFYLFFACLWFQPWYLIWLIPLAALNTSMDTVHRTVVFCFTAAMSYFVFVFHWIWNTHRLDWPTIQMHAIAVIFLLPIGFTVYSLVANRLVRRSIDSRST